MKIIIVDSCINCPYSESCGYQRICGHPSAEGMVVGDFTIVGTCPLEEK